MPQCLQSGYLLMARNSTSALYVSRFSLDAAGNTAAGMVVARTAKRERLQLSVTGTDDGTGILTGVTAVVECVPTASNDCNGRLVLAASVPSGKTRWDNIGAILGTFVLVGVLIFLGWRRRATATIKAPVQQKALNDALAAGPLSLASGSSATDSV
eukprot:g7135.t1